MNHKLDQKRFYYTHYVADAANDAATTPEVRPHSGFILCTGSHTPETFLLHALC